MKAKEIELINKIIDDAICQGFNFENRERLKDSINEYLDYKKVNKLYKTEGHNFIKIKKMEKEN